MKCPRCGNEWDVSKMGACPYCGYAVRTPQQSQQSGLPGRTSNPLLRRVTASMPAVPVRQANRNMPNLPTGREFGQPDAGISAFRDARQGVQPSFFPGPSSNQPDARQSPLANNPGMAGNRFGNPNEPVNRPRPFQTNTSGFPALPMPSNPGILPPAQKASEPSLDPRKLNNSSGLSSMSNPVMRAMPQNPAQPSTQRGSVSLNMNPQTPPTSLSASSNRMMPPTSPSAFPTRTMPPTSPFPQSAPQPGGFADRKPFFATNMPLTPTPPKPGGSDPSSRAAQGSEFISGQPTGGQARIDLDAWTAKNKPQKVQGGATGALNRPNPNLPPGLSGALPRTFAQRPQENQQRTGGFQRINGGAQPSAQNSAALPRILTAGTMLRNGRYRLHEKLGQQEWLNGVYEAHWLGHDAQHPNGRVLICEVMLPDVTPIVQQSLLRTATMALSSVGRHPHIAALWDAFNEQNRTFFVFEQVESEVLRVRVQRLGRPLGEQEVVECCLQMAEVLELLSQQSPPLVHGMITPDMLSVTTAGNHYMLTNFSIILAGGATQFISGIDRVKLPPYTPSEFSRGLIDARSDLYSLLASVYYLVTGTVPTRNNGNNTILPARVLNPSLSPEFEAILTRGLRPVAGQRYQRPSELRQDLLTLRSVTSTLMVLNDPGLREDVSIDDTSVALKPTPANGIPDHIAQALPILRREAVTDEEDDYSPLLPRPEEMAPLSEQNDLFMSTIWSTGLLLGVGVLALVAHLFS